MNFNFFSSRHSAPAKRRFFPVLLASAVLWCTEAYSDPEAESNFSTAWSESVHWESQQNFTAAHDTISRAKPYASMTAAWHARKAWLLLQLGKNQSAYGEYQAALKVSPKFVDAQSGILVPLVNMQRWQELESRAKNLVSSQPSLYAGHYYLCLVYQQSSQWRRLATQAESALTYHPMSADFLVFLARARDRSGDVDEAIQLYKSVLIFAPLNEEAQGYLKRYDPGQAAP